MQSRQSNFARALLAPDAPLPEGLMSYDPDGVQRRFAVYRNNVLVGLIGALEARFPAVRKIVGEEFFKAAAQTFATAHPPRSPVMMFYGDEFPAFLASFEPAREVAYLGDVARLEAARTRAYHAADADPLPPTALAAIAPDALAHMQFTLHPSFEIIASAYPIITIWAMNAGEMELAPITDWHGEDALVMRPQQNVEVRRVSRGAKIFLQSLAAGAALREAAAAALKADASFDLAASLAALFSGLAIAMTGSQL
jgi:hypothetical protein